MGSELKWGWSPRELSKDAEYHSRDQLGQGLN